MIYQCDHCGNPLPAGVRVCPACGEEFKGSVPADAELPKLGFTAVSAAEPKAGAMSQSTDLNRPPAMRWLDPPALRGAPAKPGAWGRALVVLAALAALSLAVHFLR